jgi:hypothetical protein
MGHAADPDTCPKAPVVPDIACRGTSANREIYRHSDAGWAAYPLVKHRQRGCNAPSFQLSTFFAVHPAGNKQGNRRELALRSHSPRKGSSISEPERNKMLDVLDRAPSLIRLPS